ncbi:hypothetical protein TB2_022839 [Malus domestica]
MDIYPIAVKAEASHPAHDLDVYPIFAKLIYLNQAEWRWDQGEWSVLVHGLQSSVCNTTSGWSSLQIGKVRLGHMMRQKKLPIFATKGEGFKKFNGGAEEIWVCWLTKANLDAMVPQIDD